LIFVACTEEEFDQNNPATTESAETETLDAEAPPYVETPAFQQIDARAAMQMIIEHPDAIILDVRTEEEFAEGHIPDAVLIPDYELSARAADELPNKDALILIYCRSGRRSVDASHILVNQGYTQVYEFGGIQSWPFEVVVP